MSQVRRNTNRRRANRRRPRQRVNSNRSQMTTGSLWNLTSRPSFRGMHVVREWIPGDPLSLTVNIGASVYVTDFYDFVDYNALNAAGALLVSARQDYRFLAIKATIIPLGNYVGRSSFAFTEDTAQTSINSALNSNVLWVQNTNNQSPKTLTWSATSITDLGYTPSTLAFTSIPVRFCAYTSTAYGNVVNGTAANLVYFQVDFSILVECRGLAS